MSGPRPAASGRPVVAALAVLLAEGRALLVRRANPPDQGKWGFPGGKVEAGETVAAAALRELAEETGVAAEAVRPFTVLDVIGPGHHYVLIAVLCRGVMATPVAADDALDARWFPLAEIAAAPESFSVAVGDVAREALALLSAD